MRNAPVAAMLATLLLAGCATVYTFDQHYFDTIPTCTSDKECEAKWAAARQWVLDHSTWRIQAYAADFIQTYGPGDTMELAFTVTKQPLPGGGYKITSSAYCGNEFGCFMDPPVAMQSFNDHVNASWRQP